MQSLDKKKTIISVVVPIYNTIEYLKDCLDSIINQTYEDFQIVLVDDGSTDGSEKLCDEYDHTTLPVEFERILQNASNR